MMDERFTQAAALFHQASRLLADLTALGARLPDPNLSARIPSGWTEAHSYSNCVERLRGGMASALSLVMTDLQIRNEGHILDALTPRESKSSEDDK